MFDQLAGGMEGTIPYCTLFFSLGGSSLSIQTSSLKDVIK